MSDTNTTSSSPPSTSEAPVVASSSSTVVAAEEVSSSNSTSSNSTAAAAAAVPPPRTPNSEAHDRAVRFGLVFTQLGAATKEEVFPHGVRHMPRLLTLKEVTEGKLKRQTLEELDAKIRRTRSWWWPFGWFGPPTPEEVEMRRREAQLKADEALRKKQIKVAMDKALQIEDERKLEELNRRIAGEKAVAEEEARAAAEAAAAAEAEAALPPPKPRLFPLKVEINPRDLTPEEEASLSTSVANQRAGIIESEKQIHQMLDAVEKTRMQYLRPASGHIKCEREIVSVMQCYDSATSTFKASMNRASALRCGPLVELLEKCSGEVAKAHVKQ